MILADKIIYLRKKCGWSQEDLAEKMNVSRQSISKWEGAQSVPDLDKILKLCQVFGVSTDYLLKDELEEPELQEDIYEPTNVKHITAEYANEFMDIKKRYSFGTAIGSALCVLSPTLLLFLCGMAESGKIQENIGVAIGLGMLLFLVVIAVMVFIFSGSAMSDYEWIQREQFVLEYGVAGIVESRMKKQRPLLTFTRAIGVGLCILGAAVVVVTAVLDIGSMPVLIAVDVLLAFVSVAVFLFVRWGNEADSFEQLLQAGEYNPNHKRNLDKYNLISGIYWGTCTAVYLAISFITSRWDFTWIIWPVAGTFFGVIACIVHYLDRNKENS